MPNTSVLLADIVLLGERYDCVSVNAGIEVHGHLDHEDDGKNHPFSVGGEGKSQLLGNVLLFQLDLVGC